MSLTPYVGAVVALGCVAVSAPAQAADDDSVVYVLTSASRFDVKTGKAGLFGFAGHGHLVRARSCSGRIVYYPNRPTGSHVEITVPTESLEVLTPPDTAEIRKVTAAMRDEVLHVERYPTISFVSTAVTPTSSGLDVRGQLILEGQTRDVDLVVHLEFAADTLRANGGFTIKQSDFGIRPYRGGPAGTVRVADRVTFELAAVAIRSRGP
jgi:polyisoprenoid-binding protein YceI